MATVPIPIVRRDLDLPVDRLVASIGTWPRPALLESGPGFGKAGLWSILTARPRLEFTATGSSWEILGDSGRIEGGRGPALDALARLLERFGLANPDDTFDPDYCPFQGGLIGYVGYDLATELERLPRKAPRDSKMPDIRFALYDTAVLVDHESSAVQIAAFDLLEEGYEATERRARQWELALIGRFPNAIPKSRLGPVQSRVTESEYRQAVCRGLEYIAEGDIFQFNLSQRFTTIGRVEPLDLYGKLRDLSPAPFAAFIAWDEFAVISASPEWFYQTKGSRIVTRPIKGTRPRGQTSERDRALAEDLVTSVKDRAELTMIIDLERNDLGRVCDYGTVRVTEPLTIESFAQVHHLVATVEGRVRAGMGPIDVVRAMFPGGSITGAPKIRAMEIIDELEPTRRGLYTGAIGYFSRGGTSAFNIAIRTMTVEGNRVSIQAGGAIVADSEPEAEYHETLAKARAMLEVAGMSREG